MTSNFDWLDFERAHGGQAWQIVQVVKYLDGELSDAEVSFMQKYQEHFCIAVPALLDYCLFLGRSDQWDVLLRADAAGLICDESLCD